MKSLWKWILGIVLVLVVVSIFVTMAFLMHGGFSRGFEPVVIQEFGKFEGGPMMGQPQIYRFSAGPERMMGGNGFISPFMPMCRFFMRLIPLTLLALLVYGAYRLGTHKTTRQDSTSASTSSLVSPEATVEATSSARTCKKCSSELQEGWRNCPICGTKQ